jgi:hypothetical protein
MLIIGGLALAILLVWLVGPCLVQALHRRDRALLKDPQYIKHSVELGVKLAKKNHADSALHSAAMSDGMRHGSDSLGPSSGAD